MLAQARPRCKGLDHRRSGGSSSSPSSSCAGWQITCADIWHRCWRGLTCYCRRGPQLYSTLWTPWGSKSVGHRPRQTQLLCDAMRCRWGPASATPNSAFSWPADRGQTTQVAKWLLLCINGPDLSLPGQTEAASRPPLSLSGLFN